MRMLKEVRTPCATEINNNSKCCGKYYEIQVLQRLEEQVIYSATADMDSATQQQ